MTGRTAALGARDERHQRDAQVSKGEDGSQLCSGSLLRFSDL